MIKNALHVRFKDLPRPRRTELYEWLIENCRGPLSFAIFSSRYDHRLRSDIDWMSDADRLRIGFGPAHYCLAIRFAEVADATLFKLRWADEIGAKSWGDRA